MPRHIHRNKVLVVPYILVKTTSNNTKPSFVMVKDRKTKEWGFISGGVKKGEHSDDAARRELREETSNILILPDFYDTHAFISTYRPPELLKMDKRRDEFVISSYKMYAFALSETPVDGVYAKNLGNYLKNSFYENNEVIDIDLKPYTEYENVWSFSDDVYRYMSGSTPRELQN